MSTSTTVRTASSHGQRRVPGEEGTWVFILGDLVVFAVFFLVYLHGRGQQPELFAEAQQALSTTIGVVYTLLLLTSSLLVVIGLQAMRAGHRRLAPRMVLAAMACGLAFIVLKVVEYAGKVEAGLVPTTNDFWMYFFVLTGLHLFHVVVGMLALAVVVVLSRRPAPNERSVSWMEGGACFWHMVDLLWIVLFPLLYFVR